MDIAVCICVLDSIKPASFFGLMNILPLVKGAFCTTGSLLPITRNQTIINLWPKIDEFSHILFIDSDTCGFNEKVLTSLYEADKDIIAPVMIARTPPFAPVHSYLPGSGIEKHEHFFRYISDKKQEPIQVRATGMAFTLIKTEVFKKIPAPWFHNDRRPRKTFPAERDKFLTSVLPTVISDVDKKYSRGEITDIVDKAIKLGRTCHKGTNYIGEDIGFCDEAKRFGFSTWIEPTHFISHIGETKFNIQDTITFLNNPKLNSRLEQLTYVWSKMNG